MTEMGKPQTQMITVRPGAAPSPQRTLPADGGVKEYLAFVLASESYALPLSSIREIMKLPPVTEVPRGPRYVLGIVSVRGRVTTVIDMRRRLRRPESPITQRSRVLLVDNGEEVLGLLVDRVLQVYRLHEDEVELSNVMGGDTSDYVSGIGRPGRHVRSRQGANAGGGLGRSGPRAALSGKELLARVSKMPSADVDAEILILLDPVELLKR